MYKIVNIKFSMQIIIQENLIPKFPPQNKIQVQILGCKKKNLKIGVQIRIVSTVGEFHVYQFS